MDIRKISIVGTGTFGVMYGRFFSERLPAGSVRFIADENPIETCKKNSITCNGVPCRFTFIPFGTDDPADLVIFAMRFGELDDVIRRIGSQVGKNTVILSLINGITSQDRLSRVFGNDRVLLCTVQGSDVSRTGNAITYTGMGTLNIGTQDGLPSDFIKALTAFFDSTGFPYHFSTDMKKSLWERLVFNTGICQAVAVYETNYDPGHAGGCSGRPGRRDLPGRPHHFRLAYVHRRAGRHQYFLHAPGPAGRTANRSGAVCRNDPHSRQKARDLHSHQ